MFETVVFYFFATVLLLAALRVITARNPVHAALFLVLAFFTAAGIWLLLRAEFLAIALVLVYVGAVMVLFLFVVMMLDINTSPLREGFIRNYASRMALLLPGLLKREIDAGRYRADLDPELAARYVVTARGGADAACQQNTDCHRPVHHDCSSHAHPCESSLSLAGQPS